MQTLSIIDEFLSQSGVRSGLAVAGGEKPPAKVDTQRLSGMIDALEKRRRTSTTMAYVVIGAHMAVLVVYIVAAWYYRSEQTAFLAILGIGSGGLMGLLVLLRRIWREMTLLDLLAAILPGASADEALKALLAISHQFADGKQSRPSTASN